MNSIDVDRWHLDSKRFLYCSIIRKLERLVTKSDNPVFDVRFPLPQRFVIADLGFTLVTAKLDGPVDNRCPVG